MKLPKVTQLIFLMKAVLRGFPGGSVVKNPASAGDVGSIPDLGRPRVPWNHGAHAPQLLSLCLRARETRLLKTDCMPRAHALRQDKPPQ